MKLTILPAAAAILALAGCASASSSSSAMPPGSALGNGSASIPGISAVSGTEVITGTATGATVVAKQTTWPLTFTGPVATTGTFTSPPGNASHVSVAFKTKAGSLAGSAVVSGQDAQPQMMADCEFRQVITAVYTIRGSASTGSFAGASGHGTVRVVIMAKLPKLKDGKCDESDSAQPIAGSAISTFDGSGPLTVK